MTWQRAGNQITIKTQHDIVDIALSHTRFQNREVVDNMKHVLAKIFKCYEAVGYEEIIVTDGTGRTYTAWAPVNWFTTKHAMLTTSEGLVLQLSR